MKVGIITTSRADFGIYAPLITAIQKSTDWKLAIYAGGMHVSEKFGYTYSEIIKLELETHKTQDLISGIKSEIDYSKAIAKTALEIAQLIDSSSEKPDLLFALGDRFEMFAAISALIPLRIKIAHLHGGEDSFGALDQKYRNAITCLSDIHFASTEMHSKRIQEIIGNKVNVFNVGALGIEALKSFDTLDRNSFEKKYGLDKNESFILSTIHPETIHDNNQALVNEFLSAVDKIEEKIIITLPNADNQGDIIRQSILDYSERKGEKKITCLENMGARNYFSAMKYCSMIIGNSSSGIIEAGSLGKLVIDVGNRQKGRTKGENVFRVECTKDAILNKYLELKKYGKMKFKNPYGDGNSSQKIIQIIKNYFL